MARSSSRPPGTAMTERLRRGKGDLWTRSADPGHLVHGESIRRVNGVEWRRWDPSRSKIAAGLLRTTGDPLRLLPPEESHALYLGAGHGGTISHLHDLMDEHARLVAVDLSPRCMRDLTSLARRRPGLVPVLGDARHHGLLRPLLPQGVSWIFQDVAQAHQASIFAAACSSFLREGGTGVLSLKVASDRGTDADVLRADVEAVLEASSLRLDEVMDLAGLQDDHLMFVVQGGPEDA